MVAFDALSRTEQPVDWAPRILVADSCPAVRESIRHVLAEVECELDEAKNGLEALAKLRDRDYDLLITDLAMSPINGFELIAALGDLPVDRQRPEVIVWSSLAATPEVRTRYELEQAALVLPRSTNEDILLIAVQAVLDDPLQFVIS